MFCIPRYTFQGYENERRTENYNWINIINRRTLLTCNTKENGKLLIFFEVLFRRSTINWRYQNKVYDKNSLLIPKMTGFIFLCSKNNFMVLICSQDNFSWLMMFDYWCNVQTYTEISDEQQIRHVSQISIM